MSWRPHPGDRVRVRATVAGGPTCFELPHFPEEGGVTGIVHPAQGRHDAPGHPYFVSFDRPLPVVVVLGHPVPLPGRHYAADELEPLDP